MKVWRQEQEFLLEYSFELWVVYDMRTRFLFEKYDNKPVLGRGGKKRQFTCASKWSAGCMRLAPTHCVQGLWKSCSFQELLARNRTISGQPWEKWTWQTRRGENVLVIVYISRCWVAQRHERANWPDDWETESAVCTAQCFGHCVCRALMASAVTCGCSCTSRPSPGSGEGSTCRGPYCTINPGNHSGCLYDPVNKQTEKRSYSLKAQCK